MTSASPPSQHPAFLPLGTQVGPWRVVEWAGGGVYGAVYRAVRVGAEQTPPVALKLAMLPGDPRFAREVELLSRLHHPHIPRLVEHGEWLHPDGPLHPYIAMEFVDGVPLYDWARMYRPDSQQVLRVLAQTALALQALHAQEAVHRDVKGANILVRRWDGRVFLTDFGSCTYPGVDTLTPPPLPPGTPAYRSPEAWQFFVQHGRAATAAYRALPADDLFALGVTACRLVTGAYPQLGEAQRDEHGVWSVDSLVLPQSLYSARVDAPLRELILRMLSLNPEQRGTALQLARDMERAATTSLGTRVSVDFHAQDTRDGQPPSTGTPSVPPGLRADTRSWRAWIAIAAAAGTLATLAAWMAPGGPEGTLSETRAASVGGPADAGPVGLGEAAVSASAVDVPTPSAPEGMVADTPPEPEPGQAKPDAKGRCPHKQQVALNNSCWMKTSFEQEQCESVGGSMYQGACYLPIVAPRQRPTTTTPTRRLSQPHESTAPHSDPAP
ncbi:serine/threonine protein kinase [Hyalangium versicolor]|uniref:serine/threonine protein kinase n=1 Tax=Hyalangium versicolor TaxID=2861190 RepID=UPI001CCC7AA3|nr:serine/threonine-protein kinase [Hyalangium versicolor]